MDRFLAISHSIKRVIYKLAGGISALLLLVLTLFAMLEIVRRYLFGLAFEWGQDAIIVGMVAAVALYFAATQVQRGHLVMHAIIQLLRARGHYRLVGLAQIFALALVPVFCIAIGVTGWEAVAYAWTRGLMTYSLLIPLWPFYLILMVGFLLTGFVAALQLLEEIVSFARKEYLDGETEIITDI